MVIIFFLNIDTYIFRYYYFFVPLPPPFLTDDSGAEFHAYLGPYKNLGLKINRNKVIHLHSSLFLSS